MEDLFFLGLTKSEVNILDNLTNENISDLHHKYFLFEEITNQKDAVTDVPFKKYKVKVQGLDYTGVVKVDEPATPIYVYGSGQNMLCSKDFADSVNIPNLIPDPGVYKEYKYFGYFRYNETDSDVSLLFPTNPKEINDNGNRLGLPTIENKLIADVYFPSDKDESSNLSDIAIGSFPLVVIIHGNGQHYYDYKSLSQHLAINGFIVVSINCLIEYNKFKLNYIQDELHLGILFDCFFHIDDTYLYSSNSKCIGKYNFDTQTVTYIMPWSSSTDFSINNGYIVFRNLQSAQGMASLARANLLYPHLQIIKKKFGNSVSNNIGIMGHSRGGEAVVRIAKDIKQLDPDNPNELFIKRFPITNPLLRKEDLTWQNVPEDLDTINAIISLAPTDQYDKEDLTQDIPYYVLYGSMEGDVVGLPTGVVPNRTSGFSIYDRTINNTKKSMSFVYGATHNGFITNNFDYPDATLQVLKQKQIARAYMNAFFRTHLKSENIWNPIFYGDYIPKSIEYDEIYLQYQKMVKPSSNPPILPTDKWLVNFENWGSTPDIKLNGNSLNTETINDLIRLDSQHTPHDTKGIKVTLPNSKINTLSFEIASSGKNISNYSFISFRIGHVVVSSEQYVDLSKIEINLISISGSYKRILNKTIPNPHHRAIYREMNLTKSAMNTIRIPLSDFATNGIDLTKIISLELIFPSFTLEYSVLIDDIEFTN
jgi:hypothetical protein